MIGVMFYIDWKFTLIALSIMPLLFVVVFTYTRKIRKPRGRCARRKARWLPSSRRSSPRCAGEGFAREDYEQRRYEVESMESVASRWRPGIEGQALAW